MARRSNSESSLATVAEQKKQHLNQFIYGARGNTIKRKLVKADAEQVLTLLADLSADEQKIYFNDVFVLFDKALVNRADLLEIPVVQQMIADRPDQFISAACSELVKNKLDSLRTIISFANQKVAFKSFHNTDSILIYNNFLLRKDADACEKLLEFFVFKKLAVEGKIEVSADVKHALKAELKHVKQAHSPSNLDQLKSKWDHHARRHQHEKAPMSYSHTQALRHRTVFSPGGVKGGRA